MKLARLLLSATAVLTLAAGAQVMSAQDKSDDKKAAGPGPVTARMTVTVETKKKGEKPPALTAQDALVRQGKTPLKVTRFEPATGDKAGLEVFILIDDATTTDAGSYINELRDFVNSQPASTRIGLGYMSNATFTIAQNLTDNHELVAKAIRLPRGNTSAMSSPYLSLIDLLKRWPPSSNRRAVILLSDGVDRLRRDSSMNNPRRAAMAPMSPDVDSAAERAQREGVTVYSIFVQGIGHFHTNMYEINLGQNSLARVTDDTGGEFYALGNSNPVSIAPYLGDIQRSLNDQYILEFLITPKKKAGFQNVKVFTEVPDAEIVSANMVWVRAAE
jgi:hypothetical protein